VKIKPLLLVHSPLEAWCRCP